MIIFGTTTKESTVAEGAFACPRCQTPQNYRQVALSRWFTLYFLPVIPLGRLGEQVECQGCYSRFTPAGATEQPAVQSLAGNPAVGTSAVPPVVGQTGSGNLPTTTPSTTTPLALTSLLFGIFSPVFLCMCDLSLVSSLAAIVTGHLALMRIRKSPAPLSGRGMAQTGLVFGYLFFVVSLASLALFIPSLMNGWQRAEQRAAQDASQPGGNSSDRLHAAEMQIMANDEHGSVSGNTPEARALAADYSKALKAMRDEFFTKDKKHRISLTKGQFVVHCELHDRSCVFLVHVPSYRHFTDDAKESLETHAWHLAQQLAIGRLEPKTRLAVGMRGVILYSTVMVGVVPERSDQGGDFSRVERDDLLAFFPAPTPRVPTLNAPVTNAPAPHAPSNPVTGFGTQWRAPNADATQAEFEPTEKATPKATPRTPYAGPPRDDRDKQVRPSRHRTSPATTQGLSQLEEVSPNDLKNRNRSKTDRRRGKVPNRNSASRPRSQRKDSQGHGAGGLSALESTASDDPHSDRKPKIGKQDTGKPKTGKRANREPATNPKTENSIDQPPWRSVGKENKQ